MVKNVTKKELNYKDLLVRYLGLVWVEAQQDFLDQATDYCKSPDTDLFTEEELKVLKTCSKKAERMMFVE